MSERTYPGTDMLIRFCYGCDNEIPSLEEMYVDSDEDVCVCASCRDKAEAEYGSDAHLVPANTYSTTDLNDLE